MFHLKTKKKLTKIESIEMRLQWFIKDCIEIERLLQRSLLRISSVGCSFI